jgi:hypothetical protein
MGIRSVIEVLPGLFYNVSETLNTDLLKLYDVRVLITDSNRFAHPSVTKGLGGKAGAGQPGVVHIPLQGMCDTPRLLEIIDTAIAVHGKCVGVLIALESIRSPAYFLGLFLARVLRNGDISEIADLVKTNFEMQMLDSDQQQLIALLRTVRV